MATEDLPEPGVGAPPTRPAGRTRTALAAAGRRLRSVTARATRWVGLHALVAALSVGAGLLVVALATEYGYHPVRNTTAWANQPFEYAVGGACAQCHEPQLAAAAKGGHEGVRCESCHGPREAHIVVQQAAASSGPATPAPGGSPVAVGSDVVESSGWDPGSSAACLACHEAVLGKPRTFPMISAATHFGTAACALCHDPHTTTALAPPIVRHELAGLPECLTCHGAGKIRAMSEAHPVVTGLDCLACHLRRSD